MTNAIEAAQIEAKAQQFATYVEMTESLTERQSTVIRYYIALHTAIIGGGGAVLVGGVAQLGNGSVTMLLLFLLLLCATGRYFCLLWRDALNSLRYWEKLKYKIIRDVEEQHPEFLELYAQEWKQGASSEKTRARSRALEMPAAFRFFYWVLGLLTLAALILWTNPSIFGIAPLDALEDVVPGIGTLLRQNG